MMFVLIFIYSCRTDQFPEAEAYNNSSKFQLTSKSISLNEAKHKAQLVAELDNVESKLKTISIVNVNVRVVDYGNGVSIDTDGVIYTENGPNYHNYTFYIKRENAPADAPLENLVLTPMTNGLYKELLISYNLTALEKQTMMNGGFVDTKGKVTITELAQNTYNPLAKGMTSCGWQEEENFAIACSSGDHHMGNVESWGGCTASRKPGWYTTTVYRCNFIYDDNDTGGGWWVGEGGGTDNGGGGSQQPGDGTTEPCNGNTTSPTDPNTNIGEGGCSGIPAPINLPTSNKVPCKQLRSLKDKAGFTDKMSTLKTNIDIGTKEKGFVLHEDTTTPTSPVFEGGGSSDTIDVNFENYYKTIDINLLYKTYGSAHNHLKNNPKHIGVPTPDDLNILLLYGLIETNLQNPGHSSLPEKAVVLVTTKIGLFALKINDLAKMKAFILKYMLQSDAEKNKYIKDNFLSTEKYNILPTSTHDQQVIGFLRFLKDMEVGADMYEGNPLNNGEWRKLNLVNNNGSFNYTQTPCNL